MPLSLGPGAQVSRWRTVFEVVTTLVMIAMAVVLVWQNRVRATKPPSAALAAKLPDKPVSISSLTTIGPDTARVAVIEYTDFQCPFCSSAATDVVSVIKDEYVKTGQARLSLKNFPQPFHQFAAGAAEAALCAGVQGKFWEMHDLLFRNQSDLRDGQLRTLASRAGVQLQQYDACKGSRMMKKAVDADTADAVRVGVSGTPTFFFGYLVGSNSVQVTDVILGVKPLSEYRGILDRLLASEK